MKNIFQNYLKLLFFIIQLVNVLANDDQENIFDITEKSPNDKLLYRSITLKNNLRMLLIYDPITKNIGQSTASLCVDVGALMDPKGFEGLAHFLEHM